MPQTNPVPASSGRTLPTGKAIYDAIMEVIEPELVTDNIPRLKALYAQETPEAKKARIGRYKAAFKEYDRCYAAYVADVDRKVRACAKTAREDTEIVAKAEDQQSQDHLLSEINSL